MHLPFFCYLDYELPFMVNLKQPEELLRLRAHFDTGQTRSYAFRIEQLRKLKQAILQREEAIYAALHQDLKKSKEETWATETGLVIAELNTAIRHLHEWMKPEYRPTNLANLPSGSRILREPLGVVLIIGPWNYPLQLLLNPLVGAIAAGNCAVIKPSELAPATAQIIQSILEAIFPSDYVLCVEGEGAAVIPALTNTFRFDHIFYTGSTTVGRIIYQIAAEQLIPVTLELGGKSPCVVEADANIDIAARRVALTKFSNAGQMCVAADYILVHESRERELINALKKYIVDFFSETPEEDYNYCRIVNEKQFDRLLGYLSGATIETGGRHDRSKLFIAPTILTGISPESPVMREEIFGPLLPVISFRTFEEARTVIAQHPNPLAFYLFTASRSREKAWLQAVPFGGGCVNNCSWHFTNHELPFGGRGASGTGSYHGRYSFETFSHRKGVLKTPAWFDPALRYPPFQGKLKWFKRLIR